MNKQQIIFKCLDSFYNAKQLIVDGKSESLILENGKLDYVKMARIAGCSLGTAQSYHSTYHKLTNSTQNTGPELEAGASLNPHSEININDRFEYIEKLVTMVFTNKLPSLFITGEGGIGKTHTVLKVLEDLKYSEEDYVIVKGFSTAKGLFETLRDNAELSIIFDDCDKIFKDDQGASILKCATDSYNIRTINWVKHDFFETFNFNGNIVFISNLPIDQFPQALQSRSIVVGLKMSIEEKIERLTYISKTLNIENVSYVDQQHTLKFMQEHKTLIKDLNVRTLIKLARVYSEYKTFNKVEELLKFIL